ncbi:MAG: hypothetical protein ACK4NP_00205 [Parvularculaceae bacterium]
MPDWLVAAAVALVALGFSVAVAFGRKRQPCAVDPRIKDHRR